MGKISSTNQIKMITGKRSKLCCVTLTYRKSSGRLQARPRFETLLINVAAKWFCRVARDSSNFEKKAVSSTTVSHYHKLPK